MSLIKYLYDNKKYKSLEFCSESMYYTHPPLHSGKIFDIQLYASMILDLEQIIVITFLQKMKCIKLSAIRIVLLFMYSVRFSN